MFLRELLWKFERRSKAGGACSSKHAGFQALPVTVVAHFFSQVVGI